MRNVVLRSGSSGPFVRDMQLALNNRLNPSPNLIVNGLMTPHTQLAVKSFQRSNWLEEDGIAGQCTLDAIFDTEAMRPILHNVSYLAQPSPYSNWATAIAMLKNSNINAVNFVTPKKLLTPLGGLVNHTDTNQNLNAVSALAACHGLKHRPAQSWPISTLIWFLQKGPVVLIVQRRGAANRPENANNRQYIVIVGARGSHAPDGNSTTLRVYDPAPDTQGGGIYSTTYSTMIKQIPTAKYGIFTL